MRTDLSLDDMRRLLSPFALSPRRSTRFEKGTVNSNFRVDTDGGPVFLRVNEGKREADVRYEGELLWHLGARRFPTPPPLRTSAGEPFVRDVGPWGERLVTVFPFWPGHELPGALDTEGAARVGAVLARLHVAARDFKRARSGIYTFDRIRARVAGFRERARDVPAIAEALPLLDEEIAWLGPARAALAVPVGTIHGDLFPDNLLWGDAPRGGRSDVSAVIDFEQASVGRYVYDLAVTLLAWCFAERDGRGRLDESLAWAMCAGYQRVRPLTPDEREALPVEARTAALRFTVTRITDVLLPSLEPGAPPPRPGKDFRDYLARLVHLRGAGAETVEAAAAEHPPLRAV